jgi:hypothetical protein
MQHINKYRRLTNRERENQKLRRKLFCWLASVSERRRGGASVSFKKGSDFVKQTHKQKDRSRRAVFLFAV